MDCFHQPLVQVRMRVLSDIRLSRWPSKWPPLINIRCRGHSSSVILIGFLQNCIYKLLPSIFSSSFNMDFVWHPINKVADKMAATYQYPLSWSLTSVIFDPIASKFYSINFSFKFEYGFCRTSDNQDGRRRGHSNLVIFCWIYFKFHI